MMLTREHKAYLAGAFVGSVVVGFALAAYYTDEKKQNRIDDLEAKIRDLKIDKHILENRIKELEEEELDETAE